MSLSRSEQMARIRSQNTEPERLLRSVLWQRGRRYRLAYRTPVGRPDLVFLGQKVAVFIDGCFWHGCPEHYVRPRSRTEFWSAKLQENVLRDHRQTRELEQIGWQVIRAWEHELFTSLNDVVRRIESALQERQRHFPEWRVMKVIPLDPNGDQEERQLVDLRDLSIERLVHQKRSTKKW